MWNLRGIKETLPASWFVKKGSPQWVCAQCEQGGRIWKQKRNLRFTKKKQTKKTKKKPKLVGPWQQWKIVFTWVHCCERADSLHHHHHQSVPFLGRHLCPVWSEHAQSWPWKESAITATVPTESLSFQDFATNKWLEMPCARDGDKQTLQVCFYTTHQVPEVQGSKERNQ